MLKKYFSDNLIVSIGNLLVRAQTFILMPIIIKSSGINIYGNFVIILSFFILISGLSSFGVGTLFKRFFPSSNSKIERQKLFYSQFFLHLFFVICISLLIYFFDNSLKRIVFDNKISFNIIYPILFFNLNVILSQLSNYFRYSTRMISYTLSTTITPYLVILGIIFFLYQFDLNIDNLFIIHIFSYLIIIVFLIYNTIYHLGFNFNIFKNYDIKKDIKLGFPLILMFISTALVTSSDRYILLHYLSSKEVGEYSVAYSIGSLILFFPMVIGVVLPPLLAKIEDSKSHNKKNNLIYITIKSYLLICIPFIFGSLAIGDSIAFIFSDAPTSRAIKFVIPILSLSALFNGLSIIYNEILFVKLQTFKMFKIILITIIINVVLNFLFFHFFNDIIFASISSLIAFIVCFLLLKSQVNIKIFKIKMIKFLFKIIFCSLLIFLLNIFLKLVFKINFLNILTFVFISVLLYFLFLVFFKIIDLNKLKNFLNK